MKKLHGIRVVAYAQKRKRRNKQKFFSATGGIANAVKFLSKFYRGYPEHSLHRRF